MEYINYVMTFEQYTAANEYESRVNEDVLNKVSVDDVKKKFAPKDGEKKDPITDEMYQKMTDFINSIGAKLEKMTYNANWTKTYMRDKNLNGYIFSAIATAQRGTVGSSRDVATYLKLQLDKDGKLEKAEVLKAGDKKWTPLEDIVKSKTENKGEEKKKFLGVF